MQNFRVFWPTHRVSSQRSHFCGAREIGNLQPTSDYEFSLPSPQKNFDSIILTK